MKFKKIDEEYFTTILDRLTRLEPAKFRYERVLNDIISKFYLDDPKKISSEDKINTALKIIEKSLDSMISDNNINDLFITLEDLYFNFDETSYQYLSNRFNFEGLINKIKVNQKTPKNVVWLKKILNNFSSLDDVYKLREKEALLYPIEKIILCEGQTEFLLLNTLFKLFSYDLGKKGVIVLAAGGKNQVAKKYYKMIEYIKIPIFVLLDLDAKETMSLIEPKLRQKDRLYLIKSGEFEDLIPKNILKNTLNYVHNCEYNCVSDDFDMENSMVKNLELIYKKYGFGEFKKAHFALELKDYIEKNCSKTDFETSEIKDILRALQEF